MNLDDLHKQVTAQREAENQATLFGEKFTKDLEELSNKSGSGAFIIANKAVVPIMTRFASCQNTNLDMQNLNWILEDYVGQQAKEVLIPQLEKIHGICIKHNFIEDNKQYQNDGDDTVFYVENNDWKVVCITTQNRKYLFFWTEYNLHVYRYWDEFILKGSWEATETKGLRSQSKWFNYILQKCDWLLDEYSDVVPDNKYIHRPTLKWFKDKNFNLDGQYFLRDDSEIMTCHFLGRTQCENALWHVRELPMTFFYVGSTLDMLEEDGYESN